MSDRIMGNYINNRLIGNSRENAITLLKHLEKHQMLFERLQNGYWANRLYWLVKKNNECVCYFLINGDEDNNNQWTLWSDDSMSQCFENDLLDEYMKKVGWEYIDFCKKCGSCSGGTRKTIFGKEFNNVCKTTFMFNDPDREALEFIKQMVIIRNNYIVNNSKYS
jgi:hypothetical protein